MTRLCLSPFFKATMTDERQIAALKYYEHTQIQKSEHLFPTLSFKRSFTLNSEWAFCRTHMHECSAGVVQASIMPSIQSCKRGPGHSEVFLIKTNWMQAVDASPQPCRKTEGGGGERVIISAAPELLHCKTWQLHGHLVETRNRSTVD